MYFGTCGELSVRGAKDDRDDFTRSRRGSLRRLQERRGRDVLRGTGVCCLCRGGSACIPGSSIRVAGLFASEQPVDRRLCR